MVNEKNFDFMNGVDSNLRDSSESFSKSQFQVSESKQILIVEDDVFLAAIIGRALFDLNPDCEIDWATNLEKALTKTIQRVDELPRQPYDLVVADVMLDGWGTGVDLWKVLARAYPEMPVMLISSMKLEELLISSATPDPTQPVSFDQLHYLQKPFSMGELKSSIRELL